MLSSTNKIFVTTTSPQKIHDLETQGFSPTLVAFGEDTLTNDISPWKLLDELDVIIITIPFSSKRESSDSILLKWNQLSEFMKDFTGQLFFMSSTGVYPNLEREFFEDDLSIQNAEGEKLVAQGLKQVNILRLAGLMGDNRLLSKYNVADIGSPVNHVHFLDVAFVIKKMIECESQGKLYNVVAPLHPSKNAVITRQKDSVDLVEDSVCNGRIISSRKLMADLEFKFAYPDPRYFHLE
ncbi:Rossmann-fold NAD(P)-binding domain-containing protein [Chryseobacterium aquaeductus]|uniref:hypothetical protein n=1 Tax=Chryseobacterium aquaeductus TaxID=2675056 RepID=UPI0013894B06|nr:hypothetical protein [Chryseobacterium aquaeductus]